MNDRESSLAFFYHFLKVGVLIVIAKVIFDLVRDPGFETSFWNGFIQILGVIAFFSILVVLVAVSRQNFNILGFFLVMIAAVFNILKIVFLSNSWLDLPENLLLVVVSVYFMTFAGRGTRHTRSST